MSVSAAVNMPPLYIRRLYQSMGENMDSIAEDAGLALQDLQYWHNNIDICDGKSWLRKAESIHICGDASKVGYGAYTPNDELQQPMVMSFDAAEIQLMRANQLSSVFREVKNVRLAVETVVSRLGPEFVAGKVIVYTGDCMPAIQDLQKMKGTVNVFPEVKRLFLFAAVHDIDLEFIWESRESDALLHADTLSRVEDSSEIFLSKSAFRHICMLSSKGVRWGFPTLDVFAGGAKDQHLVSKFYSLYFTPKALAASAMFQNWAKDACSHGRSGMLWVFPPFHLIGAVINKLLVEQTNAIVILPRFLRFWTAMLEQLPVFAIHELSYYSKLYTIGSGAPKYMQGQGKDKPIYLFTAYLVTFS